MVCGRVYGQFTIIKKLCLLPPVFFCYITLFCFLINITQAFPGLGVPQRSYNSDALRRTRRTRRRGTRACAVNGARTCTRRATHDARRRRPNQPRKMRAIRHKRACARGAPPARADLGATDPTLEERKDRRGAAVLSSSRPGTPPRSRRGPGRARASEGPEPFGEISLPVPDGSALRRAPERWLAPCASPRR